MSDQQAWNAEVLAKIEELEARLHESSGHVLALQDLLLKAAAEAEAREKPTRVFERISDDELIKALHLSLDGSEDPHVPAAAGDQPALRSQSRVARIFLRLVAVLRGRNP